MKVIRNILLVVALVLGACVLAQEPSDSVAVSRRLIIFDELQPEVQVHQSEAVEQLLLSRVFGVERSYEHLQDGFRIQVYSSNDQRVSSKESSDIAEKVRELGLGIEVYRAYMAPFWRVRLGNYRTQQEAQEALDELRDIIAKQAPELLEKGSMYVVHDEEVVLMK